MKHNADEIVVPVKVQRVMDNFYIKIYNVLDTIVYSDGSISHQLLFLPITDLADLVKFVNLNQDTEYIKATKLLDGFDTELYETIPITITNWLEKMFNE